MNAEAIVETLLGYQFYHVNEQELQEGIWVALTESGLDPKREVRLSSRERIDFMVGQVGIEVKVGGSLSALIRQSMRYVRSEEVSELLIVSTVARHRIMPVELNKKRITVLHLDNAF